MLTKHRPRRLDGKMSRFFRLYSPDVAIRQILYVTGYCSNRRPCNSRCCEACKLQSRNRMPYSCELLYLYLIFALDPGFEGDSKP